MGETEVTPRASLVRRVLDRRVGRFLLLAAPATGAALGMGAAIIIGAVPIGIASAQPIDVGIAGGSLGALSLTNGDISGMGGYAAGASNHIGAQLNAKDADLDGLCLVPRFKLPLIGKTLALRLSSTAPVRLPDVTLGATDSVVKHLDLPAASVAFGVTQQDASENQVATTPPKQLTDLAAKVGVPADRIQQMLTATTSDGTAAGIDLNTHGGRVGVGDLNAEVYRLRLDQGIRLTSLHMQVGTGELSCTS